jgi:4-hydroxythreonine-4-phosphate dehydrogenase
MGDPCGIGPEIVIKALRKNEVFDACHPLVIGDRRILERAAAWFNGASLQFDPVRRPGEGKYQPGIVTLLDLENANPEECLPGRLSASAGRAAAGYVFAACDLAMEGAVDAIVTAPLNKEALKLGGIPYPGHTELLQNRTGARKVSMLLVGETLRVIHISTHVALEEAIRRVKRERVEEVIALAHEACLSLGFDSPRIGVAGLNPHAGENGLFGSQEQEEVLPAVVASRNKGYTVSDPIAPDTVFIRAVQGEFDVVVAMYHDQGHIPMKLLAFDSGVNISIGLPIIRTSVDHGTAFDIAGKGIASENSLLAAISAAVKLVISKRSRHE